MGDLRQSPPPQETLPVPLIDPSCHQCQWRPLKRTQMLAVPSPRPGNIIYGSQGVGCKVRIICVPPMSRGHRAIQIPEIWGGEEILGEKQAEGA